MGTRSPEFEPQVHPWLALCLRISGCLSPGLSVLIYETGMLFSTCLRAGLFVKVRKDEVQMRGRSQGRTQPEERWRVGQTPGFRPAATWIADGVTLGGRLPL